YDVTAIAGFGKGGDAAKAPNRTQRPALQARFDDMKGWLHHADETVTRQRRVDHGKISWLKDIEWKMAFRQQKSTGKGKNRHGFRQVVALHISCISDMHGNQAPCSLLPPGGSTAWPGYARIKKTVSTKA